jgi:hypothetical protein
LFACRLLQFALLEIGKRSPYNFNLMIRNLELNDSLGLSEDNHEQFLKHDLKGNQHDTLAFLFYSQINYTPVISLSSRFNEASFDFYRECEREAVESIKKCCKHLNLKVLWEFYLYERLNAQSLHRVVVDYLQGESLLVSLDRKSKESASVVTNARYLLDTASTKLWDGRVKPAFNFDLVQAQFPAHFTRKLFNFDLIGPLKSLSLLKANVGISKCVLQLCEHRHSELTHDHLNQLKNIISQIDVSSLRSFDCFEIFRRVNNPLPSSTDRAMYRETDLLAKTAWLRAIHSAHLEYIRRVFIVLSEDRQAFEQEGPGLDLAALQDLQHSVRLCLPLFVEAGSPCLDQLVGFKVLSFVHRTRLVLLIPAMAGDRLKEALKKLLKDKDEQQREAYRSYFKAWADQKEFLKQLLKELEHAVKSQAKIDEQISEDWLHIEGIVLPECIKGHLEVVLETYRRRFADAVNANIGRIATIAKGIN